MILNDHLGTPQKMTDASGTVVWAADYKPFGEATVTASTIANNLRFPGQYYDAETGLNYNYYRDYNTLLGRYVEFDRIGLLGGINPYVYVNNPVKFKDPMGLASNSPNVGLPNYNVPYVSISGPGTCGPNERKEMVQETHGYRMIKDFSGALPVPAGQISFPEKYYLGFRWACIPNCCTPNGTKTINGGTGQLAGPSWERLIYDYSSEELITTFDCSRCETPCKKSV